MVRFPDENEGSESKSEGRQSESGGNEEFKVAILEGLEEVTNLVQKGIAESVGVSCENGAKSDSGSSGGNRGMGSSERGTDTSHVRGENETKREAAIRVMDTQPELSNGEVAERVGTSRSYIENIRSERRE
jgi:hypothetical protein